MTIPDVERYLPRYTRRPFPAYRFVPGKAPHPTCDPDGHSYNKTPVQLGIFGRSVTTTNIDLIVQAIITGLGMDLYNKFFYKLSYTTL